MDDVCEGKDFSFPKQEEKILKLGTDVKVSETQLEKTKDLLKCPPFATGISQYGHILAGKIKDTVTRNRVMTGYHVTRPFDWDCHRLPVEHEIDIKLGIKSREDVINMGIDKYNEECRSIVTRYVGEWEKAITTIGRCIEFRNDFMNDFRNDNKTMDLKFMESVCYVFDQFFEKKPVYRGFKVPPQGRPRKVKGQEIREKRRERRRKPNHWFQGRGR
ncbi:isoleucine--tRNA ligase, cytoplasmic-like [Rutidosis leptorrhynchoides]|uniref:isoleucine--tRNA ligase, cytoplasmic-like n=1 Tax=Rutidosis leptorrhynchoides TaxID=125765 RepID=UPI003A9A3FD2